MNNGYVIVINRNDDIVPLRHIVTIYEPYDEGDFKEWYYSEYTELDGDEFVYCPTREDRNNFVKRLYKE